MSSATVEITKAGKFWVDGANDGQSVTYDVPFGCSVKRNGVPVAPSPFVHTGPRATYEVWCDVYNGTPVTAALEIA